MGKRACLKLLCLMLLLLPALSGCGKEEDDQLGIDGYVYTAYQIDIKGSSAEKFKVMDGYIYYRLRGSGTDDLRRFPVEEILPVNEDGSVEEGDSAEQPRLPSGKSLLSAAGGSSGYISDYTVDEKGCLYYLTEKRNAGDSALRPVEGTNAYAMDYGEASYALVKLQADGSEAYSVSLPGTSRSLALGGEDWIYVLMENCILVMDDEGRTLDQLSVAGDEVAELIEGEAGTVYYCEVNVYDVVQRIITSGKPGSTRLERLTGPGNLGRFSGSRQGLFYTGSDGMLYRYRGEEGSWEAVLRWGDSNLLCSSGFFTMLPLSEDRMAVALLAYGQSYRLEEMFYVLTKTPVEELPEKEVLVMAVGGTMFATMEQYVIDFNRNSEDCHITIRHYDDLTRLDAELVSSNPPDMINLTYADYIKYGQKDVLEDLMPYLEASSVLDRAYYRQSFLDVCTVKGRLVCIPDEIDCTTVMGRASQVGSEPGWSAEDAMALVESHPQARLFLGDSFSAMIREFFREYILERYIDWERGECSFDGEGFVAFIKWVAEHSDGVDSDEWPHEVLLGTMPEERLLDIKAMVSDVNYMLLYRAFFGEEVTAVGYPTAGGEASHRGTLVNQLGIVAASDKKEEAWHFIESFLSRENGTYTFLPARQDRLEENIAKLAEEGMLFYLPDGTTELYSAITEEDTEKVYEIIDQADYTPREGIREDIINIIVEEMSPCLSGDKSYEEAAAIVQNRVKNMIQE